MLQKPGIPELAFQARHPCRRRNELRNASGWSAGCGVQLVKRVPRTGSCAMSRHKRFSVLLPVLVLCLGASLSGCALLPSQENRTTSVAYRDTADSQLGKAVIPRVAANPGYSGIYPLRHALDAFAARALLMRAAERSLDVQYYVWHKDTTGTLLFNGLYEAAERGVRVRLLLDDANASGLDTILAELDAHPNIEVRLFNPFVTRRARLLTYIFDFSRANRRMHNKSFTADNQVTIVGGRNIGDQYFGAAGGQLFADLDIMAAGPVVHEVSNTFDRYWTSESSYPLDRIVSPVASDSIAELAAATSRVKNDPATLAYISAVRDSPLMHKLLEGQLPLEWVTMQITSDDPAKGLGKAAPEALLRHKLKQIIGKPATEVDLISPYFVPAAAGVASFVALAEQGVQIRILTNSLEATDVTLVHSGYAKWRKPLLKAGVRLYESRHLSPTLPESHGAGSIGSSFSGLHAKTFAVDRSRVFVGSFNFDQRSAAINTEMGFVINSPTLAQLITDAFRDNIPGKTYEVGLSDTGQLYWVERRDGEQVRHDVEPGTTFWQRARVWIISLLPIDWML
ncbi:phospholipase D family protein [Nitrosospira sp. Is2]|uniref:phospholipase D family protein n=1 Tax=Nitrosospira sp. Is2 TaxID=3080532 RepID=UPI00295382B5|nr:phospholipase D family protein [Nitrosospira sp. Is2]WON73773.1 phospholipase D family protein [Nitrosospira sp. Is2]